MLLSPNIKRCGLSILKSLKSSEPKDAFCVVWMKLDRCFYRRRFCQYIVLFHNHLHVEKGGGFHMNNLIYPFTQGQFMSSLIEICPVVMEKILFKFVNVFSLFRNYLPLENKRSPSFQKLQFPSFKDDLC